jgi:hypothetical protein
VLSSMVVMSSFESDGGKLGSLFASELEELSLASGRIIGACQIAGPAFLRDRGGEVKI